MSRLPAVEARISDTAESTSSTDLVRSLIIGIKLPSGSLAVNTPTRVFSDGDGVNYAGLGSQAAQQVARFRSIAKRANLTLVLVDAPAGAAASGSFTFGGVATTANPILLQVEDTTVSVPVAIGDDGTAMAASAEAVLAAAGYNYLHVTASAALAVLTITAKSDGIHGNSINLKVLEPRPPGVTVGVTPMTGGAGVPDVASALAALGALRYNYICLPDLDSTTLTAVKAVLDDRYQADNATDGHAFGAIRDTVANMATFGLGIDDKHLTVLADPTVPTNPWNQAACVAARRALQTNPKLAIRNLNLSGLTDDNRVGGVVPPLETEYIDPDDASTLLDAGLSTYHFPGGNARVNRTLTLAKTNDLGQPSEANLDLETKITVSAIRQERIRVLEPVLGYILTDDASSTQYDTDVIGNIIDPEGIRQIFINQYREEFIPAGWCSDPEGFEESLIASITAPDTVTWLSEPTVNGNLYKLPGTIAFKRTGT